MIMSLWPCFMLLNCYRYYGLKKTWAVVNPLPQVGCCENKCTGLGFTMVSVADILCRIIATCPSGRWNMTWQPPQKKTLGNHTVSNISRSKNQQTKGFAQPTQTLKSNKMFGRNGHDTAKRYTFLFLNVHFNLWLILSNQRLRWTKKCADLLMFQRFLVLSTRISWTFSQIQRLM